jgi:hypothetical protein
MMVESVPGATPIGPREEIAAEVLSQQLKIGFKQDA